MLVSNAKNSPVVNWECQTKLDHTVLGGRCIHTTPRHFCWEVASAAVGWHRLRRVRGDPAQISGGTCVYRWVARRAGIVRRDTPWGHSKDHTSRVVSSRIVAVQWATAVTLWKSARPFRHNNYITLKCLAHKSVSWMYGSFPHNNVAGLVQWRLRLILY
jgi:hypothetical protein